MSGLTEIGDIKYFSEIQNTSLRQHKQVRWKEGDFRV